MTLEQLRVFLAIHDEGGVTRAARKLNMTQSAASAALAALESRHDVRLFDRVGRGVVLSSAGRAFLPEARAVADSARRAEIALVELTGLGRGELRLAASQTVAHYFIPQRLAAFVEAHPGISTALHVSNTQGAAEAVLSGEAEIALVEGDVAQEGLVAWPVGGNSLSIYCAPDHPLTRAEAVTVADLAAARWVLREKGSGTRSAFEAALSARGLSPESLDVALEMPSTEAGLSALAATRALAPASNLAAAPLVALGRIAPIAFTVADRRYDLLTHKGRALSRAARAFIDEQLG
jgi:DNA-binding transcriptional LysR family regulator